MEDSENSSDDSDAEQWENLDTKAGSMELVRHTLQGMASRNTEAGMKALGRHARTIRLGRSLWESPPLEGNVARLIEERFFDDGRFRAVDGGAHGYCEAVLSKGVSKAPWTEARMATARQC